LQIAFFNDALKNVLARGIPEYRIWHPVGKHCFGAGAQTQLAPWAT